MRRLLRAKADYRQTILRNQLTSLILYENIKTTLAQAKELTAFANRFFHRVNAANLTAKRLAHSVLLDRNAVKKLFEQIVPRDNPTTFVSHHRLAARAGDGAPMALARLIVAEPVKPQKTTKPAEAQSNAAKKTKTTKKTATKKETDARINNKRKASN